MCNISENLIDFIQANFARTNYGFANYSWILYGRNQAIHWPVDNIGEHTENECDRKFQNWIYSVKITHSGLNIER